MRSGAQRGSEMSETTTTNEMPEKFYLPAVTLPSSRNRIEAVVEDLFDFHGVVPIPTTYNT